SFRLRQWPIPAAWASHGACRGPRLPIRRWRLRGHWNPPRPFHRRGAPPRTARPGLERAAHRLADDAGRNEAGDAGADSAEQAERRLDLYPNHPRCRPARACLPQAHHSAGLGDDDETRQAFTGRRSQGRREHHYAARYSLGTLRYKNRCAPAQCAGQTSRGRSERLRGMVCRYGRGDNRGLIDQRLDRHRGWSPRYPSAWPESPERRNPAHRVASRRAVADQGDRAAVRNTRASISAGGLPDQHLLACPSRHPHRRPPDRQRAPRTDYHAFAGTLRGRARPLMTASDRVALRPPRAVLFDWDNTLVDNWATITEAFNATLTAMGHRPWTI